MGGGGLFWDCQNPAFMQISDKFKVELKEVAYHGTTSWASLWRNVDITSQSFYNSSLLYFNKITQIITLGSDYNEHPAITSRFLCTNKLTAMLKNSVTTSTNLQIAFFCIFLLVVSGTQCNESLFLCRSSLLRGRGRRHRLCLGDKVEQINSRHDSEYHLLGVLLASRSV